MPHDLAGTRVLLVGDWPPPFGGVSVHVRSLRDAVRRAGGRATVLDIGKGQHQGEDVVRSGREGRFAGVLVALAGRHDVVHLHTSGANPKSWMLVAATGLAARAAGSKAIVTFHSGHGPRWLGSARRAFAARAALLPFHRIVGVSDEISRHLERLGVPPARLETAPAFGREGLVKGVLPAEAAKLRGAHARVLCAMLAPGPDYGAEELFAAFASLRATRDDVALAVYGPGTESDETRRLAESLGAAPVLRLGQIEREEALALMAASDVFVRPTRVDGDAVSVREALAMGRPVAASRAGARPPGVHLCAPADPDDLARAIGEALDEAQAGHARSPVLATDGIDTVLRLYADLLGRLHFAA